MGSFNENQNQINDILSWRESISSLRYTESFLLALERNNNIRNLSLCGTAYDTELYFDTDKRKRLQHAIANKTDLRSLEITSISFLMKPDFAMKLLKFCPALESLVLDSCIRIPSHEAALAYAAAIKDHPSLNHVELRKMRVFGFAPGARDQDIPRMDPILHALASLPKLQHLVISCCAGTHYSYRGPLCSSESLGKLVGKQNLRSFEAAHLKMPDAALASMASQLGPLLESLSFVVSTAGSGEETRQCGLAELFCKALIHSTTIKELSLRMVENEPIDLVAVVFDSIIRSHNLTKEAFDVDRSREDWFFAMMEANHTLEALKIPSLSTRIQAIASMFLCLNKAGRRQLQKAKLETKTQVELLLKLTGNPDSLYYTLRSNPSLFDW